jgi:ABC-2 type transport system permease protein
MSGHIFRYNLKTLMRTREVVFWTLIYPIALAVFFFMAFSNLNASTEDFERISVAVVEAPELKAGTPFYTAIGSVSDINGGAAEDDLFSVDVTSREQAQKLLSEGDVSGYIYYDGKVKLAVSGSGFSQTILRAFLDNYIQTSATVGQIAQLNPDAFRQGLLADLEQPAEHVAAAPGNNPDTTVIYFYTLLAMTCMYAALTGVQEVIRIQGNLSPIAARINLAPEPKFRVFLSALSAAALLQFIIILVVLAFMVLVLGIDFGPQIGFIVLTCAVGCVTGLFFGTLVGAAVKRSEGIKYAVVIGVVMLCCFLSGMMGAGMKYMIQESAPIAGWVNPVNLLTDAFYSLFYYDGLSRYFLNIGLLLAFSAVCCTVTCLILRRQKYASL